MKARAASGATVSGVSLRAAWPHRAIARAIWRTRLRPSSNPTARTTRTLSLCCHRLPGGVSGRMRSAILCGRYRNFRSQHRFKSYSRRISGGWPRKEATMHSLIYLIGLIVVVLFILSFLGLR
jgi:hypothetical protein